MLAVVPLNIAHIKRIALRPVAGNLLTNCVINKNGCNTAQWKSMGQQRVGIHEMFLKFPTRLFNEICIRLINYVCGIEFKLQ